LSLSLSLPSAHSGINTPLSWFRLFSEMSSLLLLSLLVPLAFAAPVPNVTDEVLSKEEREWRLNAIQKLWNERHTMNHTPLVRVEVNGTPMVEYFIKNETASASGTLKHRFVWALILWAVTEGKIKANTSVFDSTSGNTGASEAYMCRLIGVNYTAVVADNLEEEKVKQITQFGGKIMKVPVQLRNYMAEKEAEKTGGFFINQFGNANGAEEFHESGDYMMESTNVFHEIVEDLRTKYNLSYPEYFIHSAGTGGTISSVGKYITRYNLPTKVVLADSQFSLFYDYVLSNKYSNLSTGDVGRPNWTAPGVAGIGYGYNPDPIIFKNSTSLLRTVIDEVARMPDMASIAAMRSLRSLGIDAGASTALNFLVALFKGIELNPQSEKIRMVIIMGDPGKFYQSTYLNDDWVENGSPKDLGGLKTLKCWQKKIDDAINFGINFITTNPTSCDI
ncbi:hypothetical protein PMAYCL1PPCAC_17698, partial [Pristionchus mayeri]